MLLMTWIASCRIVLTGRAGRFTLWNARVLSAQLRLSPVVVLDIP